METEARLIMAFKAGDAVHVKRLINEVYEDNADGAGDLRVHHLAVALRGTILRILNDPDHQQFRSDKRLTEELDRANESDSLERLRDWASAFLMALRERVSESRQWQQDDLARTMIGYVNDHAFDPAFSFRSFADHFHLAEAAMSRLFKDRTGVTFSQYVEKIRMDRARHLLTTTSRSVAEVAAAVCYSSPQAFRRAFKRYFQSAPGSRGLGAQRRP